ncbi:TolB-like translocation protein [Actinomyces bovis]|nr:hypothetical protein [Actinomyces bovis]
MSLEQTINHRLSQYPRVKRLLKRGYQTAFAIGAPGKQMVGNVEVISPNDDREYFFGYYDKSPWDASGTKVLCMSAKDTVSAVAPKDVLDLLVLDMHDNRQVLKVAESRSWNVQQGCMAQWLGPDYGSKIIFNDFRSGLFCSVIVDIHTRQERIIPSPVYSVSSDGSFALTLDFARLHRLRPGYGYSNVPDATDGQLVPDGAAVSKIDLRTGEVSRVLEFSELLSLDHRDDMEGAEHKVNHLMLNPSDERFMVLHRWYVKGRKYTRLVTCGVDGKDIWNLSDEGMVSHCFWKNDSTVLAFARRQAFNGYFLLEDGTTKASRLWPDIENDGHPSYSPSGEYVLFDSYPDRRRLSSIKIFNEAGSIRETIARVYAPFRYDNDVRCDLHPRWRRDGGAICFDGAFEGRRRLYQVDLGKFGTLKGA